MSLLKRSEQGNPGGTAVAEAEAAEIAPAEIGLPEAPIVEDKPEHLEKHGKPLPWGQISVLAAMRLSEPVTFYVIFSFLPAWLVAIGASKDLSTAGYLAGWVESSFAATQACVVLSWGRLSDRIGRKPVLLAGLSGVAVSMFCMGFSETLAGIIASRCIAGAFSGNVSVIKSTLGELSTAETQARAFSLLPMIAGIAIGGAFAEPAQKYALFRDFPLFERYEYALPCLISASWTTFAVLLGASFLRETLPPRKRKLSVTSESETPLLATPVDTPPPSPRHKHFDPEPTPIRQLLGSQQIRVTIICQVLQVYISNSILAITPLFAYAPVEAGGLGFRSGALGAMLAVRGFSLAGLQLLFFPMLVKRIGADGVFKYCSLLYPPVILAFPLVNSLARANSPFTILAFAAVLTVHAGANMAFSANSVLINSLAPSQRDLGTLHGLVQTSMSVTKVFSPALASTLFALSVDKGVLNGQLVYLILLAIAGIGVASSRYIKMPEHTWRDRRLSVSSADEEEP